MSALVEKMRRARERRVEVGGHTFIYRRPTPVEWRANIEKLGVDRAIIAAVVGWEGVAELDLIPGGDGAPAVFDPDVAAEWLADRPDLLNAIAAHMIEQVKAHAETLGNDKKN